MQFIYFFVIIKLTNIFVLGGKGMKVDLKPINEIKEELRSSVGKSIEVKEFNKQGKFLKSFDGVIEATYDNLVLVKVMGDGYSYNKSFSFAEFYATTIEYSIF
ncbi:MAG: hypothetical protein E7374_04195 [Clostridiales bacterium]|nr:hypothetical protein [Clostridiales bacterium]